MGGAPGILADNKSFGSGAGFNLAIALDTTHETGDSIGVTHLLFGDNLTEATKIDHPTNNRAIRYH